MKVKASLLFGCMSLVALGVCALADDKPVQKRQVQLSSPKAKRPQVTVASPASDSPIICYLERRGQTITIKAGAKGPIYSGKTAEGKILFENLSIDQLRAQAPEIHELIKTAVASGSGKPGAVIDAGLHSMR